jgi:hypothetical protein
MLTHWRWPILLAVLGMFLLLGLHTGVRTAPFEPLAADCNDKVPACDEVRYTGRGPGDNCECYECVVHRKGKPDQVTNVCTSDPKGQVQLRSKIH